MPTRPRTQRVAERLRSLRSSRSDVEASAVVTAEGLMVASDLPASAEEERISAMSAAIHLLGDRIATEMQRGVLERVCIHGDKGYVLFTSASDAAVLTVLARKDAKLGLLLREINLAAREIAKMI